MIPRGTQRGAAVSARGTGHESQPLALRRRVRVYGRSPGPTCVSARLMRAEKSKCATSSDRDFVAWWNDAGAGC